MATTITIVMLDDEGFETSVDLPARYEICPHCMGKGTSSAYLGAFTRDDMDEEGPEFVESYMRGEYDRPCEDCVGSPGRVLVVDEARCISDEHKAALRYMIDTQEQIAEINAIERAERAMGA